LFLLKDKQLSYEEGWVLSVNYGVQNYLTTEHLEIHFFANRLLEEEENLVVDMSKTLVRPRDIFHILKQRNNLNMSTISESTPREWVNRCSANLGQIM